MLPRYQVISEVPEPHRAHGHVAGTAERASRAAGLATNDVNAAVASRTGPVAARMTYHWRAAGGWRLAQDHGRGERDRGARHPREQRAPDPQAIATTSAST